MKFAVLGDHRQFFRKNQVLEVEGILTEVQLKELNDQIEKVLEGRLKSKPGRAFRELPGKIFSSARDLWRENEFLKKTILNSQLAEIASELIEAKPLRFGFDQLYLTVFDCLEEVDFNPYKELQVAPCTLKETTCIQGVLCGLMICLTGDEEVSDKISIFPKKAGNAIFFSPEMEIDFNELINNESCRYLMLVYTQPTAIYYLEENDPQTHVFKKLGYVFGDRLSDKLNPIIYR